MDSEPPKLNVVFSRRALNTLDDIWERNAETYDIEHADKYVDFLKSKVRDLETNYRLGKSVERRPGFWYVTIKRKSQGHGHIAVYEILNDKVHILNFYHTAQDWQSKLAAGEW